MNLHFNLQSTLVLCALSALLMTACHSADEVAPQDSELLSVKEQLAALGYDVDGLAKDGENYVLQDDIVLSPQALKELVEAGQETHPKGLDYEHYRTTNRVNPGHYTIICDNCFDNMFQALDEAIADYNALGLNITLERVTSGNADIVMEHVALEGTLDGQSDWPSGGRPGAWIGMDLGIWNKGIDRVRFVMTHELGHAFGQRHVDYFNRASCSPTPVNENDQPNYTGSGNVHIPGTPTGVDFESVMRACNGAAGHRRFSRDDVLALKYLYCGAPDRPELVHNSGTVLSVRAAHAGTKSVPYRYRVAGGAWSATKYHYRSSLNLEIPYPEYQCGQPFEVQTGLQCISGQINWSPGLVVNAPCPSSCPTPSAIMMNRSCTAATLDITGFNNLYKYQYTLANGSWSTLATSWENTLLISGLDICNNGPATFRYRAVCPGIPTSWQLLTISYSSGGGGFVDPDPISGPIGFN